jgi:hypothetical protein
MYPARVGCWFIGFFHDLHVTSDTMGLIKQTFWSSLLATLVLAAPKRTSDPPNVSLDYATFKGLSDPTTQTWNYLGEFDVPLLFGSSN